MSGLFLGTSLCAMIYFNAHFSTLWQRDKNGSHCPRANKGLWGPEKNMVTASLIIKVWQFLRDQPAAPRVCRVNRWGELVTGATLSGMSDEQKWPAVGNYWCYLCCFIWVLPIFDVIWHSWLFEGVQIKCFIGTASKCQRPHWDLLGTMTRKHWNLTGFKFDMTKLKVTKANHSRAGSLRKINKSNNCYVRSTVSVPGGMVTHPTMGLIWVPLCEWIDDHQCTLGITGYHYVSFILQGFDHGTHEFPWNPCNILLNPSILEGHSRVLHPSPSRQLRVPGVHFLSVATHWPS